MENKLGVTKIKLFVLAIVMAFTDVKQVFADGKVTFWEGMGLIPDLKKVPDLIQIFPQVKEEFKDLNGAEISELTLFIKDELSLKDKEVEEIVKDALALAENTYTKTVSLIEKIKLAKKAK